MISDKTSILKADPAVGESFDSSYSTFCKAGMHVVHDQYEICISKIISINTEIL